MKHNILAVGAHPDDIEIGCGGTILKLIDEYPGLHVDWIVFSSTSVRATEARLSAAAFLSGAASGNVDILEYRNGYFPYLGAELKDYFESMKARPVPDLILTHCGIDRHQDHRTVSELTWNTFRNHLILEYEIPKYDGDLKTPNVYVPLDTAQCNSKVRITLDSFASQSSHQWFSEDTFRAMLRLRGIEANSPSGFAEAFHCRKMLL